MFKTYLWMSMLAKNIIGVLLVQILWSPCLLATAVKQVHTRNPLHPELRRQISRESTKPMGHYLRSKKPTPAAVEKTKGRTTVAIFSLYEECDYLARPCLHSYKTGKICAKSIYTVYQTFRNYCMLDFVNCREGYDVWFPAYMGECFTLPKIDQYMHYPYDEDFFLDEMIVPS
ncbi:uncharacterized protein LOC118270536 [Spodoptera frugiperda]|uniref:Uncharacterized protein LOC118270536 n=1 Tax=Spodoptera frugiperda TaxID=7108 RepID=A0A9R0EY79_SPOFR|nr:uncharacterized protein LOC118270536 [Spodoptera frugiperda]